MQESWATWFISQMEGMSINYFWHVNVDLLYKRISRIKNKFDSHVNFLATLMVGLKWKIILACQKVSEWSLWCRMGSNKMFLIDESFMLTWCYPSYFSYLSEKMWRIIYSVKCLQLKFRLQIKIDINFDDTKWKEWISYQIWFLE